MVQQVKTQRLLYQAIATGIDETYIPLGHERTYQLVGSVSSGSGTCVVDIEVSNDGENFVNMHTMEMNLSTTVNSDTYFSIEPWKYVRGNVTAISGTDASVDLTLGNKGY